MMRARRVLLASLLFAAPAQAQVTYVPQGSTVVDALTSQVKNPPQGQSEQQSNDQFGQQLQLLQALQRATAQPQKQQPQDETPPETAGGIAGAAGDIKDKDSAAYKADKLATQATKDRASLRAFRDAPPAAKVFDEENPPPDLSALKNVGAAQAKLGNAQSDVADPDKDKDAFALDLRKQAQKEAALSYGARGGLAKRSYGIMEEMRGYDKALDRVFDFRQMLIKAPSGMLIEPPIVKESLNALLIDGTGDEAAVADRVYDINKKAKIVSAPRDWRQYLLQSWADVPPPPKILWPRNAREQADWNGWIEQGWQAGTAQADDMFEASVNQLVADYGGMVRYRMLLAQGMISAPFAAAEDRGVTGEGTQMRVGDRALRITGPAQFQTRGDLWTPADR